MLNASPPSDPARYSAADAASLAWPSPTTALAAATLRWRKRLPRQCLVLLAVCLTISVLLYAMDGGRFGVKLTYSLCIGLACNLINDLSFLLLAAGYDRQRSLRGLPPSTGPFGTGWAAILPAALVCLVVGPPLGQWAAANLLGFRPVGLFDFNNPATRVELLISGLATMVLILVLSGAERLATARAQAEAAQRLAAENQLRMLQSQLEPHMLFNTLANLRVLIGLDPNRAQAMLDRLIAFLRATLNASRTTLHPLSSEFQHTDDYLALMAIRMGPRLSVKLDLPADLATIQVPPLLLQPLVENGIKHGLEPKVEGGRIEVSARQVGNELLLLVRDTGIGLSQASAAIKDTRETTSTHFGLEQVRARLQALHGDRAQFTLCTAEDAEGGTLARITLPLQASP